MAKPEQLPTLVSQDMLALEVVDRAAEVVSILPGTTTADDYVTKGLEVGEYAIGLRIAQEGAGRTPDVSLYNHWASESGIGELTTPPYWMHVHEPIGVLEPRIIHYNTTDRDRTRVSNVLPWLESHAGSDAGTLQTTQITDGGRFLVAVTSWAHSVMCNEYEKAIME